VERSLGDEGGGAMSDRLAFAAIVLASAALMSPGHLVSRARLTGWATPAGPTRVSVTVVRRGGLRGAPGSARRILRYGRSAPPAEPTALAGAWDLLAASLRCGLPVASAVRAVAGQLPGAEGGVLRRVADVLALGADPATAWRPALACPTVAGLATAAVRTARSGAAMADAIDELAAGLRASATDHADAKAQRAGVLIACPLGLCFLPAFFCLGIAPVVIGLARQLLNHW
jgi:Type II secretion system (T2SS), protein F